MHVERERGFCGTWRRVGAPSRTAHAFFLSLRRLVGGSPPPIRRIPRSISSFCFDAFVLTLPEGRSRGCPFWPSGRSAPSLRRFGLEIRRVSPPNTEGLGIRLPKGHPQVGHGGCLRPAAYARGRDVAFVGRTGPRGCALPLAEALAVRMGNGDRRRGRKSQGNCPKPTLASANAGETAFPQAPRPIPKRGPPSKDEAGPRVTGAPPPRGAPPPPRPGVLRGGTPPPPPKTVAAIHSRGGPT